MNAITTLTKAMQLTCDVAGVSMGVVEYLDANDEVSKTHAAMTVVMGAAHLGCGAAEMTAKAISASNKTLSNIKSVEIVTRVLDIPVKMNSAIEKCRNGNLPVITAIEQGIAPIASLTRASIEGTIYQEKHYLDMTPEQRSKEERLVSTGMLDSRGQVIYKKEPVTEESCREILEEAHKAYAPTAITEIALRTGVISKPLMSAAEAYAKLTARLNPPLAAAPNPAAGAALNPQAAAAQPRDPFDLVALNQIPEELHGDPALAQYICPITQVPIRFPVGDPTTGRHIYEHSAIVEWINGHHNSPMSRQPLAVNQLVPKPATLALINARLTFHSNRLRALAAAPVAAPVPPAMQAAANVEN